MARVTVVAAAFLLTGCWSLSEVNDLALITVAALDRTPEGQYRWAVIVPVPEQVTPPPLSGGGGNPSSAAGSLRTGSGPSPALAAEALEVVIPREVRWTHADHILIGEQAAGYGLRPVLEFSSRRYQVERRARLYVTRGDAFRVLEQYHPSLERSLARSFDEISGRFRPGTLRPVDVNTFLRWLDSPGLDPHLPVVRALSQPGSVIPAPGGIALFRKDRLAGFLRPPADRGLLFMRGEIPPFTLMVRCPEAGPSDEAVVAFRVQTTTSRVRTEGDEGNLHSRVRIDALADLFEWGCQEEPQPASVDRVARAAETEIRRQAHLALRTTRQLGVDPVGFGNALYRSNPRAWHAVAARWRSMLATLPVTLEVRVRVRSYEMTTSPP